MDRRELLKMIAVLTGTAVVGGDVFLSGCTAGGKMEVGFTPANIALLNEVGETILPATSSPGAKEAQVGEFMKVIVTDCYTTDEQDAFVKGIGELNDASRSMHGSPFIDCTLQQRHDLLVSLEKEAREHNEKQEKKDKPGREAAKKADKEYDFVASPKHYYTMMKQLTLWGFFTSEPGATKALRYEPVPTRYDGDYPYKKGDKAWAE